MRTVSKIFICGLATCVFAAPALAQSQTQSVVGNAKTTRIETRPFYGAVVTIESGVRVFRPLPVSKHVVINPHGRTPLSLNHHEIYSQERIYSKSRSHNYIYDRVPRH